MQSLQVLVTALEIKLLTYCETLVIYILQFTPGITAMDLIYGINSYNYLQRKNVHI